MTYDFFNWFAELGQLTGVLTFAVTILGMFSLLLVNMGRYFQAKKFGIPLCNVHQANIAESAELWISLLGALGFGVILPVVLLNVELSPLVLFPVLLVSFLMGLVMTKSGNNVQQGKGTLRDGKVYVKVYETTLLYYSAFSLLALLAYIRLHGIYYETFISETTPRGGVFAYVLAALVVLAFVIYFYFLSRQLFDSLVKRLFGNTRLITVEIDGKKYFVAMRHNQYQWFLMEYELVSKRKVYFEGTFLHSSFVKHIALFTKGSFIIKDLSELEGPLKSFGFDEVRNKSKCGVFTYEFEAREWEEMNYEDV